MAMKVYLNGDVVTVDKTGGTSFNIPSRFAKYTVIGDSIKVSNIINLDQETDLITEIQNQAGTVIGNLNDVRKYLSGFIFLADSQPVRVDISTLATSENQNTIIAQNTEIEANITTVESNTRELNKIKELTKETNKVLKKIYN